MMEYTSTDFVLNMGTMFGIWILIFFVSLVAKVLTLILPKDNRVNKYLTQKLQSFYWNGLIETFEANYLLLTVCSFL